MSNEKQAPQTETTKKCSQCHKKCARDQFSIRQWRTKSNPSCRLCAEYTKISKKKSRTCHGCELKLLRTEFAIFQWSKGDEALCHSCSDKLCQKVLSSISMDMDDKNYVKTTKELPDGTVVCKHSKESCDVCMMEFRLTNDFARKRNELGRELEPEEFEQVTKEFNSYTNVRINKKVCIMDGQPVCPRSSRKMRCPCNEVTYCSAACQKHHWMIHQMTCKWRAQKEEEKLKKKKKKEREKQQAEEKAASKMKLAANSLTDEQKNVARIEAFFAEKNGGEHSMEECAWQLDEHPFVIGGGSITCGLNGEDLGEEFIKGDVAKIYRERLGVEWDGSPRFGIGPCEQKKTPVDWIAKARQGKSQRRNNIEDGLKARLKQQAEEKAASKLKSAANGLTEDQKNVARIEAFLAENNGVKHSVEECAWQLGEHPFVIGEGSITYGLNGEEFIKGDVAKIHRERFGVEWDGSPRFGIVGSYKQKKNSRGLDCKGSPR